MQIWLRVDLVRRRGCWTLVVGGLYRDFSPVSQDPLRCRSFEEMKGRENRDEKRESRWYDWSLVK